MEAPADAIKANVHGVSVRIAIYNHAGRIPLCASAEDWMGFKTPPLKFKLVERIGEPKKIISAPPTAPVFASHRRSQERFSQICRRLFSRFRAAVHEALEIEAAMFASEKKIPD